MKLIKIKKKNYLLTSKQTCKQMTSIQDVNTFINFTETTDPNGIANDPLIFLCVRQNFAFFKRFCHLISIGFLFWRFFVDLLGVHFEVRSEVPSVFLAVRTTVRHLLKNCDLYLNVQHRRVTLNAIT